MAITSTGTASFRVIGVKLEMDRGRGILETVKTSEIAPDIQIAGSLDGYGVRELSFTLFGARSPLQLQVLRTMRRVRLTLYRGVPGNVGSAVMFDGYTRDVSWQAYPPRASVTCQDSSILYATQKVAYALDAFAGKTRLQVVTDILTAAEIVPATPFWDTLDCPGTVYKAIQEGGDKTLLDFLTTFTAPAARRAYWRSGVLRVVPTALGTPVRTLRSADVRAIRIIPPAMAASNTVQFTALVYGYTGAPGTYTVGPVTVSTYGTYTPAKATQKQNHLTGAITSVSPSVSPQTELTRTVTTTNWDGGTIISQTIDEYSWYAPKACQNRQQTSGVTSYNNLFDVYDFGGGDWRAQDQETFMITRSTSLLRTFYSSPFANGDDSTGFLAGESKVVSRYVARDDRLGTSDGAGGFSSYNNVLTRTDGTAWISGEEVFLAETEELQYYQVDFGSDHRLHYVLRRTVTQGLVLSLVGDSNGAAVYGPSAAPRRAILISYVGLIGPNPVDSDPSHWRQFGIASLTVFSDNDSASHAELGVSQSAPIAEMTPPQPHYFAFPVLEVKSILPGQVPTVERKTAYQVPQTGTVTMSSSALSALNGEIVTQQANDFCETPAEIANCALDFLRRECSPVVEIDMDVDGRIYEGDTIALDIPSGPGILGVTYGAALLLVKDVQIAVNGDTGYNQQTLRCLWYPPDLLT